MAALAIPIIAAASPLLTPLIQSLVMYVEHRFGAKQGPTKLDTVVNAVLPVAVSLATAGQIPGQLDAAHVAAMVEAVVQRLKDAGVLNPETAAVIAAQPIAVSTLPTGTLRVTGGTFQLQFG